MSHSRYGLLEDEIVERIKDRVPSLRAVRHSSDPEGAVLEQGQLPACLVAFANFRPETVDQISNQTRVMGLASFDVLLVREFADTVSHTDVDAGGLYELLDQVRTALNAWAPTLPSQQVDPDAGVEGTWPCYTADEEFQQFTETLAGIVLTAVVRVQFAYSGA